MSSTAEVIVRTFEAVRQTPGAAYEAERMLAYLTEPSAPTGRRVRDTFAGRRRLVLFMESLQLEFGICFTNEEWERGAGLADLTRTVESKLANRSNQARLAAKRVQEARVALVDEPIKIGLLSAAALAVAAMATRSVIGYVVCGSLWLAVLASVVTLNIRGYNYARRLAERAGTAVGRPVGANGSAHE